MEALRSHDTDAWPLRIWQPHYRQRGVSHTQRSSMSTVDEPAYRAWQTWIRELSPKKPGGMHQGSLVEKESLLQFLNDGWKFFRSDLDKLSPKLARPRR